MIFTVLSENQVNPEVQVQTRWAEEGLSNVKRGRLRDSKSRKKLVTTSSKNVLCRER